MIKKIPSYSNEIRLVFFYQISIPQNRTFNACRKILKIFFPIDCFSSSRVDEECISPDVKNSIHVGDRILEINGTPIHNVPLDEVSATRSL